MKISGLVNIKTLEKIQFGKYISSEENESYAKLLIRLKSLGKAAENNSIGLFIDAEENWIQDVIDDLANRMMRDHNTEKAIIFNTFQMYRHDRLEFLKSSLEKAKKENYILGAKVVRGAYMEKERERAKENGYPSPIQKDKISTDKAFNSAIKFCVENHHDISLYNATHNSDSNLFQAELMLKNGIARNHPHLNFCQLYGMSDIISYNLENAGFNIMKYVPYGQIKEVIPYLIRRAQENTSVSGEMGREYKMIKTELDDRKK